MNILFIMSDSLAPHFVGAHGDPVGATPNLDGLAARGVLFERAYCNSPICASSRASMVTGRYLSEVGAFDNGNEFSSEWPTMGHVLRARGYETAIIGKMHFVGHDQHHGFDRRLALDTDYSTAFSEDTYQLAYEWREEPYPNPCNPAWMAPSYAWDEQWRDYRHHYDRDQAIHREALAYLNEKELGGDPFFACVSYHHPHNPFWIPEDIRALFRDKDLPLPRVPEGVDPCHGPMDEWLSVFHHEPGVRERLMTEENLRWLYETFYGMVYDLDQHVGELLALLEARGLAEDTAIVFASDHGDMMARRGMVQKRSFYEPSVRCVLMGSWPGHWQEGARIDTPASLIDLLPTFADMAEAPVPDGLPGVSLLPSMKEGSESERRVIFSEYHGEGVHAPCFMAVDGQYKFIYVHGHEERLYNVVEDPDEYENLIDDARHGEAVARLRAALLEQFDPEAVALTARQSQRNRRFIYDATRDG
jgi:choline-sulfatase